MKTYALQLAKRNGYVLRIEEVIGDKFAPTFKADGVYFERKDVQISDELFADLSPKIGTVETPKFVATPTTAVPAGRMAVCELDGELVVVA